MTTRRFTLSDCGYNIIGGHKDLGPDGHLCCGYAFSYHKPARLEPFAHPDLLPHLPALCAAKSAEERKAILERIGRKFTVEASESSCAKYKIRSGLGFTSGYLYVGGICENAQYVAHPDIKDIVPAVALCPTVATAQALIDAHLADAGPTRSKVSVEVKKTVEFEVTLNSKGQVTVDCEYWTWVNDDEADTALYSSPVDYVSDALDAAKPTTVAQAIQVIKGAVK